MAELAVKGLKELTRTFSKAPSDVNRAYRAELRTVAEPTKSTAETLATSRIRKMTPAWAKMRVGITQKLVYVAPRQRGVKGRAGQVRRRPKFGTLMMDRAMQPALDQHQAQIARDFDVMLDRLVVRWDRGA